ncbi:MAG: hypothetical protein LAO78_11945 [Acidobacteriia bacterium]|nr:hypothetical protein [Terriglobia bacterium]
MNHVALEQMQEHAAAEAELDLSLLAGNWVNTNLSPSFIRSLQLEPGPNQLIMRVTGADSGSPKDWGEATAQVFAENTASTQAMAFSALFDLGGMDSLLQGYVVKGVLVIVSFTRVKDGRERSSSFGKEFFYRVP